MTHSASMPALPLGLAGLLGLVMPGEGDANATPSAAADFEALLAKLTGAAPRGEAQVQAAPPEAAEKAETPETDEGAPGQEAVATVAALFIPPPPEQTSQAAPETTGDAVEPQAQAAAAPSLAPAPDVSVETPAAQAAPTDSAEPQPETQATPAGSPSPSAQPSESAIERAAVEFAPDAAPPLADKPVKDAKAPGAPTPVEAPVIAEASAPKPPAEVPAPTAEALPQESAEQSFQAALDAPPPAPPAPKRKDEDKPARAEADARPVQAADGKPAPDLKPDAPVIEKIEAPSLAQPDAQPAQQAASEAVAPAEVAAATDLPDAPTTDLKPQPAPAANAAPPSSAQAALTEHAPAVEARGAPETVANFAAHILLKLEGQTTRFEVQLDPIGLGLVDVRMDIDAEGQLNATFAFDNPQAAAELRGRAGELHKALEQAGFDMSKASLSFEMTGQGQHERHAGEREHPYPQARAFRAVMDATETPLSTLSAFFDRRPGGVDIRI